LRTDNKLCGISGQQTINYKSTTPTNDERADSQNCNGNTLKKSTVSSVGDLYGSAPQLRHRVATFDQDRNALSRPVERAIDIFHANPHSINQLDFHDFNDGFEPGHIADDYVGPAMELVRVTFLSLIRTGTVEVSQHQRS